MHVDMQHNASCFNGDILSRMLTKLCCMLTELLCM